MQALVSIKNGKPTVSSKEIADKFNKPHKNVIRDIKNLKCSDEFRKLNFEPSTYTSPQNKKFECFDYNFIARSHRFRKKYRPDLR